MAEKPRLFTPVALRGVDVIDCSSGGLAGSATAARVKCSPGFQVPYAERVRREALVDPSWALHAQGALGLQDEFESWPVQAGWWLERRRRAMARSA
ncbi:MAG: hypothetical protein ACREVC_03375 [Burkholderiales bacterium]